MLVKLNGGNFLPNNVCQQLFACRTQFSEIDPWCQFQTKLYKHLFCTKVLFDAFFYFALQFFGEIILAKKAACKMLVKMTLGVNFYQHFMHAFFVQKCFFCQNVTIKKLPKRLSYEKCAGITSMKLTAGVNVINVLPAAFAPVNLCSSFWHIV
jgi:hypothetical protein